MKTNEQLNADLYQKLCEDFEWFEDNLLDEDPREMLQSSYGYLIRQDIVSAMEDMNLSDKQCKTLLLEEHPLEKIYEKWLDHDFSYMDEIRETISSTANEKLRQEFIQSKRESR